MDRCTVERLMRSLGLQGVGVAPTAAPRNQPEISKIIAEHLVKRQISWDRPSELLGHGFYL